MNSAAPPWSRLPLVLHRSDGSDPCRPWLWLISEILYTDTLNNALWSTQLFYEEVLPGSQWICGDRDGRKKLN